ncbi:hypothetical protein CCR75_006671 [Bremia lactucae]|uniref:GOLD domain-containing protein n=1 Tax=Bremia lactucae TaxID=4779 RepID=A0A976IJE7_BRELC|nr:hypothetical protein CCR75_006671 [Bremia lactucae]
MTRRAKERRVERVHAKLEQHEQRIQRINRLNSRPVWSKLLEDLDRPFTNKISSNVHVSSTESPKHKPLIVDELQWKSSQVPIAASGGFQLPIKLDAEKGELHYTFSTRNYDVNFGVQMICADGSLIELLSSQRYESQKQLVEGQLSLTGPGMALLLWDNSFSWLNTKQLAYHVELKQEALSLSEAEKTQLASQARLERERKLEQTEAVYDGLETQLQTENQTINFLHYQIKELQLQLKQHEEERELINEKRLVVEDQIEELCWELRALSWRCLDQTSLYRIFDFLSKEDLLACVLCCHNLGRCQAKSGTITDVRFKARELKLLNGPLLLKIAILLQVMLSSHSRQSHRVNGERLEIAQEILMNLREM